MECGGLGCTQMRLDGFGLRLSVSDLGWDWLALCLCRFGLGGKQPIGPANMLVSLAPTGVKAADIAQELRWLASLTTHQPTNHKQTSTDHTPQAHSFVSIVTEELCASLRLPRGAMSGWWNHGRQSNVTGIKIWCYMIQHPERPWRYNGWKMRK